LGALAATGFLVGFAAFTAAALVVDLVDFADFFATFIGV
jgi:hypothetical protein